jgi:hypothetical protein
MAFCNSCGATLDRNAKFCAKCGATITEAPLAAAPPGPPPKSSNVVKTVLIVGAVAIGLLIAGLAVSAYIGLRIARHTRVTQNGKSVRVESPFGTVETTQDPAQVARDLGVDVYPGAEALKTNSANVRVGGMHTTSAEFETNDSVDKVAAFYKAKFPNANITTQDGNQYTIVSMDNNNILTINLEPQGGKTLIKIASVKGARGSSD